MCLHGEQISSTLDIGCIANQVRRVSILSAFTLYVMAGRELFTKRQELRAFNTPSNLNPFDSFKTTDVLVTSELATVESAKEMNNSLDRRNRSQRSTTSGKNYERYSVNIVSSPMTPRPSAPHANNITSAQSRKNRAAMEANRAAWGYTKVAILFFVSLLITWVTLPSTSIVGYG